MVLNLRGTNLIRYDGFSRKFNALIVKPVTNKIYKKILREIEAMLSVVYGKHPLIELTEELLKRVLQIPLTAVVVVLQGFEEVDEDVRVSLVDDAVSLLEKFVELGLWFRQQIREKIWKNHKKTSVCCKNLWN